MQTLTRQLRPSFTALPNYGDEAPRPQPSLRSAPFWGETTDEARANVWAVWQQLCHNAIREGNEGLLKKLLPYGKAIQRAIRGDLGALLREIRQVFGFATPDAAHVRREFFDLEDKVTDPRALVYLETLSLGLEKKGADTRKIVEAARQVSYTSRRHSSRGVFHFSTLGSGN